MSKPVKPSLPGAVRDGVIIGTFYDVKAVHSNGVHRFVFEVASHIANEALEALGGLPDPGKPVEVAICRVKTENGCTASADDLQGPSRSTRSLRFGELAAPPEMPVSYGVMPLSASTARGSFTKMPLSQQTGILRNDPNFWEYLEYTYPPAQISDAVACRDFIRHYCEVESCAQLDTNMEAGHRWIGLEADFWAYKHGMR